MPKPLITSETVRDDWIDYNGHMNVAYYVLAFDHATDALFDSVGADQAWRERDQASIFVVESHVTYENEVGRGDALTIETHVAGLDKKRVQLFHIMSHNGKRVATNEIMAVAVDLKERRSAALPEAILRGLEALVDCGSLSPEDLGRSIRSLTAR